MKRTWMAGALLLGACGNVETGDSGESEDTDSRAVEGVLPPQPENAGVAYIGHYLSTTLAWTRTDGPNAVAGGEMNLQGSAHDLELDAVNDRLIVVQDVEKRVDLFQLDRPKNASTAVAAPELIGSIETEWTPFFSKMDPYHDRLYVFLVDGETGKSEMHIYGTESPELPFLNRFEVPTSAAWDIDPVRQLLFIYDSSDGGVHVYDLHGDESQELTGSPIPFGEWFPETNNWSFSVRNLRVEPWTARVYAGRPQGTLSELIAFQYDGVVPGANTSFAQLADMSTVEKLEDAFDVSVSHEERPYLLESHGAVVDPEEELVFLAGRAWNGTASTDLVLSLGSNLEDLGACPEEDKGWCWLKSHYDGQPGSYLMSEGSNCIDTSNNVLLATSVDLQDDEGAGQLHL
ncbi:MAG: hypothetical protein VXW32_13415 [Myxococcota bacterium]|nr:hypothetical protein [Myxococcota bacterium]